MAPKSSLKRKHQEIVDECIQLRISGAKARKKPKDKYINLSLAARQRRSNRQSMQRKRCKQAQSMKAQSRKSMKVSGLTSQTRKCMKASGPTSKTRRRKRQGGLQNNRNQPTFCCGRRRQRCICATTGRGLEIAQSFSKRQSDKLYASYQSSPIQTFLDVPDMAAYSEQVDASMPYTLLWPYAFMWRFFSNPEFWRALMLIGAVSSQGPPVWSLVTQVMAEFEKHPKVSFASGLFYSGHLLQKYRYDPAKDWLICDASMSRIDRHIKGLQVMWYCCDLLKVYLDELHIEPTRAGYRACTAGLCEHLRIRVGGLFGHYAIKIFLDAVFVSQPSLKKVCCWFPMLCPAYQSMLPLVYTAVDAHSQEDLWVAACQLYERFCRRGSRLSLPDVLAQLCWLKRGVGGEQPKTCPKPGGSDPPGF